MNATWLDTLPWLGQAGRIRRARARVSRPAMSFLNTSGGSVRLRRLPSSTGPGLLIGTDGPNVIEHYDELVEALAGRADLVIFEPPGTGASTPAPGFDFSVAAFTRVAEEVASEFGPRTLIFPCYLGFVAQQLARQRPDLVTGLVLPQTPDWAQMERWVDRVDPKRVLRTPVVGQAFMALRRRHVASGWYRFGVGHRELREKFIGHANEAFDFGGCYCLASLMQGFSRGPAIAPAALPMPVAVVWGEKDKSHANTVPERSVPGADVVRFATSGHSPELEEPAHFAKWLLTWHQQIVAKAS